MAIFNKYAVIVTGAGQGIGHEICRQFAREGASVGLNDIDPDLASRAAQGINQALGTDNVMALPFDIGAVSELRKATAEFAAQFGRLDCFVANAGITKFGDFLEYEPEDFDELNAINLRGSYFSAQAAARIMIQHAIPGRIILMSSVTGVQALPSLSAYGMTKAAIRMLAKCLALELGPHRITVNAVAPGATLTERTLEELPEYAAQWEAVTPNGQVGQVGDIASAILFLASPQAGHISGQTLTIDGGWTARSQMP